MRLAVLILALAMVACAGLKPYRNDAPQNLSVRTELDAGVRATLHVHHVDGNCRTEYQGGLALDRSALTVGLPAERVIYLDVLFDTSSLLAGSRRMNAGTLIKPRAGFRYEVAVAYRDSMYQLAVRETDPRTKATRELPRRDLGACS